MMYTPEEIDRVLTNSFNGEDTDIENYNGSDDDIESFSGVGLAKLETSDKRFSIVLENSLTTQKTIAITPGRNRVTKAALVYDDAGTLKYKVPGGHALVAPSHLNEDDIIITYSDIENIENTGERLDAVIDDGIFYAEDATHFLRATCTEADSSMRQFLDFLKANPTVFAGLHITSNKPEVYDSKLRMIKTTPFGGEKEIRVPFQDGYTDLSANSDKIIVDKKFQLDGDTLTLFTLPAESKVTLTFVAGAVSSQATSLKRRTERVQKNVGKEIRKVSRKATRIRK